MDKEQRKRLEFYINHMNRWHCPKGGQSDVRYMFNVRDRSDVRYRSDVRCGCHCAHRRTGW